MSSDCSALSNVSPWAEFLTAAERLEPTGAAFVLYTVVMNVTKGMFTDSVTVTFSQNGIAQGAFTGILIPAAIATGVYNGTAALTSSIKNYVGQQIIGLSTTANGKNAVVFSTNQAAVGTVLVNGDNFTCAGGIFSVSV
jgi:hypothetical protein